MECDSVFFEGKVKTNICQLEPGLVIFGGAVMQCGWHDKDLGEGIFTFNGNVEKVKNAKWTRKK